jgi:phage tail-like protein
VADARTIDPPFVGRFKFEVGPDEIGFFTEVSGLSVQIDVEELAEGGQNAFTHRLLGRMKWPNLVFKRGITNTDNLFKWLMTFSGEGFTKAGNKVVPIGGSVTVLDSTGKRPVRVWSFRDAKPVRWSGPRLAASSRDLAVEELEVCHCGFTSSA